MNDIAPQRKPLIFDVFLMYNELDLLELRLKTLYDHVDYFVLTEVDKTFVGKPKPMYFAENMERFSCFSDKIIYNPIINDDIINLRKKYNYSNLDTSFSHKHHGKIPSKLPQSRLMEMAHRDSGIVALSKYAKSDDIILLSDVDEIVNPLALNEIKKHDLNNPVYLEMDWYLYWMTNKCAQKWYGTVACNFSVLKKLSIDHLRVAVAKSDDTVLPGAIIQLAGWHFSYMGGYKSVREKMDVLGWQGFRALKSRILERFGLVSWKKQMLSGKSILLQNKDFQEVEIDESYPVPMQHDSNIARKFQKNNI